MNARPGVAGRRVAIPLAIGAILVALFVALGVWQVERRTWKLDLIARVERHLAAAPVAAPGPGSWAGVGPDDAYRRVTARGRFRHAAETRVEALTVRGAGWWVVTPLVSDRGFTVLVNRGFVPEAGHAGDPAGPITVTGLLRLTEPDGRFLRANDPAADRWYSRDVAAIARRRGLGRVAPYFIDAEAGTGAAAGGLPVGGLTVVAFRNTHLVYALTWFALALLTAGAMVQLVRLRRAAL